MMTEPTELELLDSAIDDLIQAALLGDKIISRKNALKAQIARLIVPDVLDAEGRAARLTTPQGKLEYYRDLVEEVADENKRLLRDLAEYEADAEIEAAPSLFQRVMTISPVYVARFGGTISLEGAMRKMHEEWDEMHEEIKLCAMDITLVLLGKAGPDSAAQERLAKEAIDLLVTIGGVLHALDVPITLTAQAADATLEKLDSRTTDDYAWQDTSRTVERIGKIAK